MYMPRATAVKQTTHSAVWIEVFVAKETELSYVSENRTMKEMNDTKSTANFTHEVKMRSASG